MDRRVHEHILYLVDQGQSRNLHENADPRNTSSGNFFFQYYISTTRANNVTIFGVNINSLLLLELLAIFPKTEESFKEKFQKVYKFFTYYLNVRG